MKSGQSVILCWANEIWTICHPVLLKSEQSVILCWAIEIWTICHSVLIYWNLNNLSLCAELLKSEQSVILCWAIEIWTICHPVLSYWNLSSLSSYAELLKSEKYVILCWAIEIWTNVWLEFGRIQQTYKCRCKGYWLRLYIILAFYLLACHLQQALYMSM